MRRNTRIVETVLGRRGGGGGVTEYPPLPDDQRRRLLELFADENEKLFALLGRDVPA